MFNRSLWTLSIIAPVVLGTSAQASSSPRTARRDENACRLRPLVSDQVGEATILVNAWGLVAGPSTPWWVADDGTDVSTLYDGDGK
jgi:hypothetical protein